MINQTEQRAVALIEQAIGALARAEELTPECRISRPVVTKAHSEGVRALSALKHELYRDASLPHVR